jgi:hypothetical protein
MDSLIHELTSATRTENDGMQGRETLPAVGSQGHAPTTQGGVAAEMNSGKKFLGPSRRSDPRNPTGALGMIQQTPGDPITPVSIAVRDGGVAARSYDSRL